MLCLLQFINSNKFNKTFKYLILKYIFKYFLLFKKLFILIKFYIKIQQ